MRPVLVFLITFSLLLSLGVSAKENKDLMKANYYYSHFGFHEAIPYYEKIADRVNNPATYARLGDCYRLTGNIENALLWYAKAAKMQNCEAIVLLKAVNLQ